jgi:multidrug efflux system outer membrane protein
MTTARHTASTPRAATALALCGALLLGAACATKTPPSGDELRQQSQVLSRVDLQGEWKTPGATPEQIQDNWLATFNDPQLDALVVEALDYNPDLRIAATRVAQAEQYVVQAKAMLLPGVDLFGTGGVNMGGGDITSALQGISLKVSWEPDLWGRLRYGRNAAQATYASVAADYEFSRQSLAASVARAWFTASETALQKRISQDVVESAEHLQRLAQIRQRVGPGSELDVALARANVATARDNAQQVELAHSQSVRALELLLGRYPAAELHARQELTAMPGPIPAGLPLQMLERRPDLVAAEQRVAAAFNRVGEAKAAMLPRIILNANVARLESDILELSEDFSNPVGGAGAKLLAPVYQGGELRAQVQIRTLEQKEALEDYARVALRALGDVENGLAASETLAAREALLQQAVADNQRAMELALVSYRVGSADQRDVQQQQIDLQTARLSLLRVESERLSQRTSLHLALGGSF